METLKITQDSVKNMSLVELQDIVGTNKKLTAVQKQFINTRIKALEALPEGSPVEDAQEKIASDAVTKPEPEVAVVVKKAKNKPNETTRTIEKFTDDTKGIRAGTMVDFLENNKPGAKTLTGKVQRLFDFYANPKRQEAKIMVGTQRYYRFETGMTVHVEPTPEPTAPEAIEGAGI